MSARPAGPAVPYIGRSEVARGVFGKFHRAIWWKKSRFFGVEKPVFLCKLCRLERRRKRLRKSWPGISGGVEDIRGTRAEDAGKIRRENTGGPAEDCRTDPEGDHRRTGGGLPERTGGLDNRTNDTGAEEWSAPECGRRQSAG